MTEETRCEPLPVMALDNIREETKRVWAMCLAMALLEATEPWRDWNSLDGCEEQGRLQTATHALNQLLPLMSLAVRNLYTPPATVAALVEALERIAGYRAKFPSKIARAALALYRGERT